MKSLLICISLLFFNCSLSELISPDNGEIKIISITPSEAFVSDSTDFSITYSYNLKDIETANVVIKGTINHPDSSIQIGKQWIDETSGEKTMSFKLLIPSTNLSQTITFTAILQEESFIPREFDSHSKTIDLLR